MPVPTRAEPITSDRVLLKDVVHDRIRDAIWEGTLHRGEVLRDAELVEWLGVSRTPLRGALDDLAREGFVETASNRYTRVADPERSDAVSAAHALGTLYAGALRFALPSLTDETNLQLQRCCDDVVEAVSAGRIEEVRGRLLPLFHDILMRTTNALYRDRLARPMEGLRYIATVEPVVHAVGEGSCPRFVAAVQVLRDAIAAKDVRAARDATEEVFFGWLPEA